MFKESIECTTIYEKRNSKNVRNYLKEVIKYGGLSIKVKRGDKQQIWGISIYKWGKLIQIGENV